MILLLAMGASRADAEDATQEAMILAWQQWESIREPAAWVRTAAVRCFWRQARKKQKHEVALDETVEPATHPELEIFGEEQRRVLRLLRGLPEGQRTVAALYYDGLACEEIAELMGKPPATIRSQLRHARNTLKEVITSEGL